MAGDINQQVIADRLGISRATVSRCFTGHAGISPVTRAKVFQVAAEIGYTHMETRAPKGKKPVEQKVFSVLICTDKEEYLRGDYESPGEQILTGVTEFALNHDILVDVNLIPPTAQDLNDASFQSVERLRERKNVGMLLIYPFAEAIVDELALKFPIVSLVDQSEHISMDCVDVDHYMGIASAVDYLHAMGHRRIGFYTREYAVEASWSFRRYSAFIERMARLRLEVDCKDLIGMFPNDQVDLEESIELAAQRTRDGVTAWVCAADHQGYDLVAGLEKRGLSVPKDVSVTGFDGITKNESQPQLTTVKIPFREIGATGVERLASRLKNRSRGKRHVYISGKLLEGETVAQPRTL